MNWEAAGVIAEIVGAAAVVITLVYLARQIRFASDESRVQGTYASLNMYANWRAHTNNNPELPELVAKANRKDDITESENARLGTFFEDLVMASYCSYATSGRSNPLYEKGAEIVYLAAYLNANPAMESHWARVREYFEAINNDFPSVVDARRADTRTDETIGA